MASSSGSSQSFEKKSRTRISSLSRFLGTHKVAMKWKSSLLLSEYFTKKITRDPGTFDVDYNDTPAVRKVIAKSREMFYTQDECLDEFSFMNEPQNSYELSPVKPFKVSEVTEIVKKVMEEIDDEKNKYKADGDLCKLLADEIKLRVKNSEFSRYKIVCVVSLLRGSELHDVMIASRCLWNKDFDNFVQDIFKNKHFTAVATVYALYHE